MGWVAWLFAVATEQFFDQPLVMIRHAPEPGLSGRLGRFACGKEVKTPGHFLSIYDNVPV
jgi:hypothetical protein